jgi:hypothetical protein
MQILNKAKSYFLDDDARYFRNIAAVSFITGGLWFYLYNENTTALIKFVGALVFLGYLSLVFTLINERVRKMNSVEGTMNIAIDPKQVEDLESVIMQVQAQGRYDARRPI